MADAEKEVPKDRMQFILEIVSAIVLSLATISGAYAAWVGSLWGGNQATSYTKATMEISNANTEYLEASQLYVEETIEFASMEILDVMYTREVELGNPDFAKNVILEKLNDDYKIYYDGSLTPEQVEVKAKELEEKRKKAIADAMAASNTIYEQATKLLVDGQKFNTNGDNFGLLTVLFAIAMFFSGFVNIVHSRRIQIVFLLLSIAMFAYTSVNMAMLPYPF